MTSQEQFEWLREQRVCDFTKYGLRLMMELSDYGGMRDVPVGLLLLLHNLYESMEGADRG